MVTIEPGVYIPGLACLESRIWSPLEERGCARAVLISRDLIVV